MRPVRALGPVALVVLAWLPAPGGAQAPAGVLPQDASRCPAEHPVKGYTSRHSGSAGVYYLPDSPRYDRVVPERCFASENEARAAGYRSGREESTPARQNRR